MFCKRATMAVAAVELCIVECYQSVDVVSLPSGKMEQVLRDFSVWNVVYSWEKKLIENIRFVMDF